MKKLAFALLLFLAACQPADPGPKPSKDGNTGQAETPAPVLANLIVTQAGTTDRPNQITQSTKNITTVDQTYAFQTDKNIRFMIETDLQGSNCIDASPVLFFWATTKEGTLRLPVKMPFSVKADTVYQLKVRIENVHCDSVDLRFAFRHSTN